MASIAAMPLTILRNSSVCQVVIPCSLHPGCPGRAAFCSSLGRVCQLCLWWHCSQLVLSTEAIESMIPARVVSTDLESMVFLQR